MSKFKRNLITTALPYANGPVHIGHLAGVYVPADIYVRYLRKKGEDVAFIGGSDEHGVPITIKAQKEGVTPQDIVDRYHKIIKDSFEELGISFDIYSRTSSKTHHELSSAFFKKLYDEGKFIEKTSMQFYDEKAGQFLADRYIVGKCPHCGNERAYGDQCEACGTSLNATDLIDPVSAITGNKPELKETKHWYLPLDQYEGWLKEWILEEHKEWKPNVYGQCKSWLDNGLQPRAVTRDLDWGVPVPIEGAEGKVLYVWFDAPIGYISATKDLTPEWEKYWKDPETRMIHFIGKDNIVFHCIIFPAMLKADGSYILPDNVPANEFLNLEGDKISTSRNWAVWLHEYLVEFPGKQGSVLPPAQQLQHRLSFEHQLTADDPCLCAGALCPGPQELHRVGSSGREHHRVLVGKCLFLGVDGLKAAQLPSFLADSIAFRLLHQGGQTSGLGLKALDVQAISHPDQNLPGVEQMYIH